MSKPVSIIVGAGAQNGLGAAICRRFSQEGFHTVAVGRTQQKVDAIAAAIRASGGSAEAVVMDATSEADVQTLFAQQFKDKADHGVHAVVFNAAGINRPQSFLSLTGETGRCRGDRESRPH